MPKDPNTEPTLAHPPVVSQDEWDAARTALLEREQTVGAAMHELAAARNACRWCGWSTTTRSRVLTGGGHCSSCSTGAAS